MKFLFQLLAALLLWMFIACNDQPGRSDSSNKEKATADMLVQPMDKKESVPAPAPASISAVHMTPPVIVKDEKVADGVADSEMPPAPEKPYNTEDYDHIVENRFLAATQNPLSTFSIDVDEAAYSNIRRYINDGSIPPAGAVRIEEMVNYFKYDYPQPEGDKPFTVNTEIGDCPWNPGHRLALIGLQGKNIPSANLPASNLVFLMKKMVPDW